MSDLAKRLRDGIDEHVANDLYDVIACYRKLTLEAADALEAAERECHARNCIGLSEEVTDLKGRLAIAVEALKWIRSAGCGALSDEARKALARIQNKEQSNDAPST